MSVLLQLVSWPMFGIALLIFGFAPGAMLRLIVLLFPRDDPRRHELLGELHAVPRFERPFWVVEQFEVALFEGLAKRLRLVVRVAVALTLSMLVSERMVLWQFSGSTHAPGGRSKHRAPR